jgi:dephospho-CoA kinase
MNLKFLSTFFKRKENIEEVSVISSLAPKVLMNEEDLKKVEPYLDKLKDTLNAKSINNIALTGGYGSGKSTILKTFQYWNKNDYNFLNISLAAFNQTKTKENFKELFDLKIKNGKSEKEAEKEIVNEFKETIINNEELERQLEISILQQIVYKVKPSNLPESRFKRIVNIPNWKLWGLIPLSFTIWIISVILLFKYNFLDYVNPKTWTFRVKDFELSPTMIFLFSFMGIGYFSKLVVSLFSNSKINKVNLKGEIEIGDNSNKSILNEHYDEILYYFEKNPFNVVVIEDLDRFENTNIFTKLRELNILLNNADTLKNKEEYKKFGIKFLYAVGDDLFDDKKERVKFFEYIIPVIPFINSTNAEEQLKTLIKDSDLEENVFSKEFISDITTFIDDIDMRLLINIFHEFVIYRKVLNPNILKGSEEELFAMITYKNIEPEDFNKLNNKEGKLYNLINNKKSYITVLVKEKNDKIAKKTVEIEDIEEENISNIKELRQIYINQILTKLPNNAIYFSEIKINDLKEEDKFDELISEGKISYRYQHPHYSNSQNNVLNFDFDEIENEVNPNFTFEDRKYFIESKHNDRIETLQKEIEKLKKEKNEIENWDLTQIFREVDINQYLSEFSNNGLLRNLVLEGYINENYNDYISLFHEVSLTVDDKKFEKSVKASFNESFEYKLTHSETIADKLELKWFSRDSILNFDLLDFLGEEYDKYSQKYNAFIQLLSNEKQRSIEFIDGYIERKKVLNRFIEKITIKWGGFWDYVFNKSTYDVNKKYYIFEIIILNLNLEKLIEIQSGKLIKKTIEENIKYLYNYDKNYSPIWFESQIEKLLPLLNIKILRLEQPNENSKYLFELIYKKGHYKITNENILLLLNEFSEEFDNLSFETTNYSAIQNSKCEPLIKYINEEIDNYIENVYLKLENNVIEDEESLKLLLNNDKLDSKLKLKIIEKVETKISDLSSINDIEVKKYLLIENKVVPKWDNVISYYKESENKIDDSLVKYLNFENVNSTLSKNKLVRENKDFEISLMLCNELTDVNYDKFLNSCYFGWNKLNFEDVDFNKVVFLTNKVLNTTKDNYDILRENFKNNHIKLLEKNFTEILVKFEDFEADGNDILLILKSEKINIVNKFDFITKIDETIIGSNKEIAKIIGEIILQKSKTIDLTIDIKKIILNSLVSIESKVKFVTLYNESLGTSELIELVKNISWSYGELFKKQHKPTFKANNYNIVLLGILKSKGLIKNFDIDKKDKTLIRAVANY